MNLGSEPIAVYSVVLWPVVVVKCYVDILNSQIQPRYTGMGLILNADKKKTL